MDKTLYLNESHRISITVDGPSLWIRQKSRASRRIPARLIGRVLIFGNVRMTAGVVALFASRGIQVSFYNRQGKAIATALPRLMLPGVNGERLKNALTSVEGQELLNNWMLSQHIALILEWLKELHHPLYEVFSHKGFDDALYQGMLNDLFGNPARRKRLSRLVDGMVEDEAVKVLGRAGLDVHIGIRSHNRDFGLCTDFRWIMQAETDRIVNLILNDEVRPQTGKQIVADRRELINTTGIFERRRRKVNAQLKTLVEEVLNVVRVM